MKSFAGLFLWSIASVVAAVEPVAPELFLRINGRAAASEALAISRGEPLIAEVVLRSSDRDAAEPISLDPPTGGWASRINIAVTDASGAALVWSIIAVGKTSTGALALQPDAVTTLVLRLDGAAGIQVAAGRYQLLARLDLSDGRGWRGVVESDPIAIEVTDTSAAPTGDALGRRQLFRVRDALLAGDAARAESVANEMLSADFLRPEAYVAKALIAEGKGDRRGALTYVDIAVARATGISLAKPAPGASEPVAKPVPIEYYELRQRIEKMETKEPEPEPLPGYPENIAVAPATVASSPAPAPRPASQVARTAPSAKVVDAVSTVPATPVAIGSSTTAEAISADAEFLRDPHGQWAVAAEASSAHGTLNYGAQQATGAPNVTTYADHPETWVSASADRGDEWLKLTFANSVHASAVRVRQVLGPGTIVKIEAFAADGRSVVVWAGRDRGVYAKNQISWFIATFVPTEFPVRTIKITLDTRLVMGWNSIDAVQLVGEP